MQILSILLIPILGAVIGFSTNVLAIVMIFRPHKQWRIFGVRVPFTPGLMPKEQAELARKIGETLRDNVLTQETLIEAAGNTHIVENIVAMVDKAAENFVHNPKTLGELCVALFNRSEDEIAQAAASYALKGLGLAQNLPAKAADFLRGDDFRRVIVNFGADAVEKAAKNNKKLGDLIPNRVATVAAIKSLLKANTHRIEPLARRILDDPATDTALRGLTEKLVKANAGGLLGMFVKPAKIYDNIRNGLLEHLATPEGQAKIGGKLAQWLDNLLEMDVTTLGIADKLTRTNTESWLDAALHNLQKALTNEHVDKLQAHVHALIDTHSPAIAEKAVSGVLALVPAEILANVDYKTHTAAATRKLVGVLAEKAGQHVVGALDIAAIAETKINAFQAKEIESLVLSVAGKHLKWIAMLGGVLGFIIGFLPALIT